MIGYVILYLAVNAAITVATRSGMRKRNIEPALGETMFIMIGLLAGVFALLVAIYRATKQEPK